MVAVGVLSKGSVEIAVCQRGGNTKKLQQSEDGEGGVDASMWRPWWEGLCETPGQNVVVCVLQCLRDAREDAWSKCGYTVTQPRWERFLFAISST